jgi:hypothetical protein
VLYNFIPAFFLYIFVFYQSCILKGVELFVGWRLPNSNVGATDMRNGWVATASNLLGN